MEKCLQHVSHPTCLALYLKREWSTLDPIPSRPIAIPINQEYLTITHLYLPYVVHYVNLLMVATHFTHFGAILDILHYIKGLFHGLHFSSQSPILLHAYTNIGCARDPTNHRSTTSFCFPFGFSLISWHNKKQTMVAHSNTKVKYRDLAIVSFELPWLRCLWQDTKLSLSFAL